MRSVRRGIFIVVALGNLSCAAHAQIRMLDASEVKVPLAIGADAQVSFTLRNPSPNPASVQLSFGGVGFANPPKWTITTESSCPLPALFTSETVALAGNGELQCAYRLTRTALAQEDRRFVFNLQENGDSVQSRDFLVGDLTALQVQTRVIRFGAVGQTAQAEVHVRNIGPSAIGKLGYGTCVYPGMVEVNVVGGDCVAGASLACFGGGNVSGFTMTNLPVGAVQSCVLEWAGVGAQAQFALGLIELTKASGGGVVLLNTQPAAQTIAASGAPVALQLPLGGGVMAWFLLGGMLVIGLYRARRATVLL